MSSRPLRSLLGCAAILAPFAFAVACGSSDTGSAPTPGKDSGVGTYANDASVNLGDDDASLGGGDDDASLFGGGDDSSTGTTGGDGSTGGSLDAGPAPFDSGTVSDAAAHATFPLAQNAGGSVLATPHFVSITFPSYTYQADVDAFMQKVGQTQFWSQSTKEYGVAAVPAENVTTVHLTTSNQVCTSGGTCTDATIQSWLKSNFTSKGALGVSDASAIYVIYFPEDVTISQGPGAVSCQQFGGYHDEVDLSDGKKIAYAVIPTCAAATGASLTPLNNVTLGAGHELIEAATDPTPETNPAWFFAQTGAAGGWALAQGAGELSDLCENDPESTVLDPETMQYVQRSWSNAQAALGADPCVPHLALADGGAEQFIDTIAVPMDTVAGPVGIEQLPDGGTYALTNFTAADLAGTTAKTIEVKLITGPGQNPGAFKVKAVDYAGFVDSAGDDSATRKYAYLSMTWDDGTSDTITGYAGEVHHLTITATTAGYALGTGTPASDQTMGPQSFPFLPVWILSEQANAATKTVTEEHLSYFSTNLVSN